MLGLTTFYSIWIQWYWVWI